VIPQEAVVVTAKAARSRAAGPGALETDVVSVEVPRFRGQEGGQVFSVAVPMQEVTYTSSACRGHAINASSVRVESSLVANEDKFFIM
jgi:hypothetical protein